MESLPTVSVIIPTYNRAESLRRTLDSLARQTYPVERYEVIGVDDGGSDGSEQVLGRSYRFALKYFRQNNRGAAVARNTGPDLAQGELYSFPCDEITVVPACISSFVAVFAGLDPVVAVGSLILSETSVSACMTSTATGP